ncbi:MAG: SulP family inorganic anion transporter, partial [Clostridia bacterium]|nr:SulP family inorganic anion transporter [Deltaproteobacteria bacterium]
TTIVPGSLLAVIAGVLMARALPLIDPALTLDEDHYVTLPAFRSVGDLMSHMTFPSFEALKNLKVWGVAVTVMAISSIEAMLSIDAADKLDPYKRTTPANTELRAQGIGNIVAGLLGGLPVTAVIIRSTVNVSAGARTKLATLVHGLLLLIATLLGPTLLNHIPLSALAALLILSGYKLFRPTVIRDIYKKGWDQFVPFAVTIVAILFSDLMRGIAAGIVVGVIFILRSNFKRAIAVTRDGNKFLVSMTGSVSFLNKTLLKRVIDSVPKGSYVLIDGTRADFIDKDITETLRNFVDSAEHRCIEVELKRSPVAANPLFKSDATVSDYLPAAVEAFSGKSS